MSEWTDIGEQLRKSRESKGLDLRDVAHSTRIPLTTLSALEESDYSIFPSPTYARSFLSQYSEYLDVDAHAWIEAFETGDVLSQTNDHEYLQDHDEHIGEHYHDTESASQRGRTMNIGGTSLLQTLTVFIITAILIGLGIFIYKKIEPMLSGSLSEESSDVSAGGITTEEIQESSSPPKKDIRESIPEGKPTPLTPPVNVLLDDPQKPTAVKPSNIGLPSKAKVIDEN